MSCTMIVIESNIHCWSGGRVRMKSASTDEECSLAVVQKKLKTEVTNRGEGSVVLTLWAQHVC